MNDAATVMIGWIAALFLAHGSVWLLCRYGSAERTGDSDNRARANGLRSPPEWGRL